jgi:hypothetical protein
MIVVPVGIITATIETFVDCGRGRRECAVFWTSPVGVARVDRLVHPSHRSSRTSYEVDEQWLNEFCFALGRQARTIQAQVHTHPGEAFHSTCDDLGAVAAHDGFLSIVVPDFGMRGGLIDARAYHITASGWQSVSLFQDAVGIV